MPSLRSSTGDIDIPPNSSRDRENGQVHFEAGISEKARTRPLRFTIMFERGSLVNLANPIGEQIGSSDCMKLRNEANFALAKKHSRG